MLELFRCVDAWIEQDRWSGGFMTLLLCAFDYCALSALELCRAALYKISLEGLTSGCEYDGHTSLLTVLRRAKLLHGKGVRASV